MDGMDGARTAIRLAHVIAAMMEWMERASPSDCPCHRCTDRGCTGGNGWNTHRNQIARALLDSWRSMDAS